MLDEMKRKELSKKKENKNLKFPKKYSLTIVERKNFLIHMLLNFGNFSFCRYFLEKFHK